eukprot:c2377_g1_i1.p1 GENE.c2377_g1_i1~~c2377_g1_i1.p1  ORF type:complete len:212 (-),score=21.67 c2377_g1_i1:47-682(-)
MLCQGTIPPGCRPGSRFDVMMPDGQRIPLVCPPNRTCGDQFILRPFSVTIPQGVQKGQAFRVQVPGVGLFKATCPKDKRAGDSIVMHFPEFPDPKKEKEQSDPLEDLHLIVKPVKYDPPADLVNRASQITCDADSSAIPSEFICPITQELMLDPVLTIDGHSYERKSIENWLLTSNRSPKTNKVLPTKILIPNLALRSRIINFVDAWNPPS